jgi:hypothetical protein
MHAPGCCLATEPGARRDGTGLSLPPRSIGRLVTSHVPAGHESNSPGRRLAHRCLGLHASAKVLGHAEARTLADVPLSQQVSRGKQQRGADQLHEGPRSDSSTSIGARGATAAMIVYESGSHLGLTRSSRGAFGA